MHLTSSYHHCPPSFVPASSSSSIFVCSSTWRRHSSHQEMERGQAQDQQSLMAVEVSGDSESGPDSTPYHGLEGFMEGAAEDEDDMESCSCYDGYGNACVSYIDGDDDDDDDVGDGDGEDRNEDDDVGDGQERDDVRVLEWPSGMERTKWVKTEEGEEEEEQEEAKVVDRAEEDRRFWEACLASGYP